MNKIFLFLIAWISFLNTSAQDSLSKQINVDTLRLLSGKSRLIHFNEISNEKVRFNKIKVKDSTWVKGNNKSFFVENVFQVALENGEIVQVYKKDSLMGNYLSIEDMKVYIAGLREARNNYSTFKTGAAGFALGLASGGLGAFWGVLPCGVYGGVANVMRIDDSELSNHPKKLNNEVFYAGYKDQAQIKQRNTALISSGIGLITSIITLQILTNNGVFN